uniref:hypothetical protein n=1 Tax=Streptomyces chilikensis TaxID=1194079 RepID=UPI0019D28140
KPRGPPRRAGRRGGPRPAGGDGRRAEDAFAAGLVRFMTDVLGEQVGPARLPLHDDGPAEPVPAP